jgi:hypothetical protein
MSWLALLLVPLALYLAYKLVSVALKLALAVAVLVAVYWWAAPYMGWPTVPDLFHVFGPDLEGRRIEELADPARLTKEATGKVVEGVVDEVVARSGGERAASGEPPAAEPELPAPSTAEPATPPAQKSSTEDAGTPDRP